MKWLGKAILVIALVVGIPVGSLWLWGRPREHVALPTVNTSPADVVRTFARALNARDYGTCKRMGIDGAGVSADWTTVHGPQIRDLKIEAVGRMMRGSQAANAEYDSGLRTWEQTVIVDTTETLVNFDGQPDPEPGHVFSFQLVRHNSSQPWQIYGAGEG